MALQSIDTISPTEDTEIREAAATTNYSNTVLLRVGSTNMAGTLERKMLWDFPITSLTGKRLNKIILNLTTSVANTNPTDMILYRLLYDTGEVDLSQTTWNNRTTASAWDGSAAAGTAGTDYDSSVTVTTFANGSTLTRQTHTIEGKLQINITPLVQEALDDGYSSLFLMLQDIVLGRGSIPIFAIDDASGDLSRRPFLSGTIKVRRKIKKSDVKIKQSTRATLSGARVQHTTIQASNASDILVNAHLETQYQIFEEQMPVTGPPLMTLSSSSPISTNGNLVTLNKDQMEIILKDNFPYKVRMRYRDIDGWTPWGAAASFRTRSKDYKYIREGSA